MWPGFNSRRRRNMWVEFVVGSLPCSERFFSGYSGFPLSSKTNTPKFQFDLERKDTLKRVHMNSLCASWVNKQKKQTSKLRIFVHFQKIGSPNFLKAGTVSFHLCWTDLRLIFSLHVKIDFSSIVGKAYPVLR